MVTLSQGTRKEREETTITVKDAEELKEIDTPLSGKIILEEPAYAPVEEHLGERMIFFDGFPYRATYRGGEIVKFRKIVVFNHTPIFFTEPTDRRQEREASPISLKEFSYLLTRKTPVTPLLGTWSTYYQNRWQELSDEDFRDIFPIPEDALVEDWLWNSYGGFFRKAWEKYKTGGKKMRKSLKGAKTHFPNGFQNTFFPVKEVICVENLSITAVQKIRDQLNGFKERPFGFNQRWEKWRINVTEKQDVLDSQEFMDHCIRFYRTFIPLTTHAQKKLIEELKRRELPFHWSLRRNLFVSKKFITYKYMWPLTFYYKGLPLTFHSYLRFLYYRLYNPPRYIRDVLRDTITNGEMFSINEIRQGFTEHKQAFLEAPHENWYNLTVQGKIICKKEKAQKLGRVDDLSWTKLKVGRKMKPYGLTPNDFLKFLERTQPDPGTLSELIYSDLLEKIEGMLLPETVNMEKNKQLERTYKEQVKKNEDLLLDIITA